MSCCNTLLAGISVAGLGFMVGNGLVSGKKKEKETSKILFEEPTSVPFRAPITVKEPISVKEPQKEPVRPISRPVGTEPVPVRDIIEYFPIAYTIRNIGYFIVGSSVVAVPLYIINIARRIYSTVNGINTTLGNLGGNLRDLGEQMGYVDMGTQDMQKTIKNIQEMQKDIDIIRTKEIVDLKQEYGDFSKTLKNLEKSGQQTVKELEKIRTKYTEPINDKLNDLKDKIIDLQQKGGSQKDIESSMQKLDEEVKKRLDDLRNDSKNSNDAINKILDNLLGKKEKPQEQHGVISLGENIVGFGMQRTQTEMLIGDFALEPEEIKPPVFDIQEPLRELARNEIQNAIQENNSIELGEDDQIDVNIASSYSEISSISARKIAANEWLNKWREKLAQARQSVSEPVSETISEPLTDVLYEQPPIVSENIETLRGLGYNFSFGTIDFINYDADTLEIYRYLITHSIAKLKRKAGKLLSDLLNQELDEISQLAAKIDNNLEMANLLKRYQEFVRDNDRNTFAGYLGKRIIYGSNDYMSEPEIYFYTNVKNEYENKIDNGFSVEIQNGNIDYLNKVLRTFEDFLIDVKLTSIERLYINEKLSDYEKVKLIVARIIDLYEMFILNLIPGPAFLEKKRGAYTRYVNKLNELNKNKK